MFKDKLVIGCLVVAILALILSGYAVVLNREPGPEGPMGPTGPQGEPGEDGNDAVPLPANMPPKVTLVTQSGYLINIFPSVLNKCKYTYNIVVDIKDMDDESFRVTFYYKCTKTGSWIQGDIFYGEDGKYESTVSYTYNNFMPAQHTNYWLIEAWDGSDISKATFEYTIVP